MRDPNARFRAYLQRWWSRQISVDEGTDWRRGRDVYALASEFRRDRQFEIAQAGFLHRRLSPFEARDAVDQVEPRPAGPDSELLTDAIVRASSTARRVRTTTALGAFLTVSALIARNLLRRRH